MHIIYNTPKPGTIFCTSDTAKYFGHDAPIWGLSLPKRSFISSFETYVGKWPETFPADALSYVYGPNMPLDDNLNIASILDFMRDERYFGAYIFGAPDSKILKRGLGLEVLDNTYRTEQFLIKDLYTIIRARELAFKELEEVPVNSMDVTTDMLLVLWYFTGRYAKKEIYDIEAEYGKHTADLVSILRESGLR